MLTACIYNIYLLQIILQYLKGNAKSKDLYANLINPEVIVLLIFIAINYVVFVYSYMIHFHPQWFIPAIIIFHLLFFMLIWSTIKSIIGNPGKVPKYWRFNQNNNNFKYCLYCSCFKPYRSCHCLICKKCVLNMDHHCNNLQLQVFTYIRTVCLFVQIEILVVISIFFAFNIGLVLNNSSTFEYFNKRRNPNLEPNVYNVGSYENFTQVFGNNALFWPFSITSNQSQKANGIFWPKNTD